MNETTLFLGPLDSALIPWLTEQGEVIEQTSDKIDPETFEPAGLKYLVSYGYKHHIPHQVFSPFGEFAVNLHISFLPWNSGCDPNFWSFITDTPKGVTIHRIDDMIDGGSILFQKRIEFNEDVDTLKTSYYRLKSEIENLFKENWELIKAGGCESFVNLQHQGSYHRSNEKDPYLCLLTEGWDTPVSVLTSYAADTQMSVQSMENEKADISNDKIRNQMEVNK